VGGIGIPSFLTIRFNFAIVSQMAWYSNSLPMLRVLIQDLNEPHTYSDDNLYSILCSAASLVQQEVNLPYVYIINFTVKTITPDPNALGDVGFEHLMAYKAACLIGIGAAKIASANAIDVADNSASIKMAWSAKSKMQWGNMACLQYEDIKKAYQMGRYVVGKSIVSPYGDGKV